VLYSDADGDADGRALYLMVVGRCVSRWAGLSKLAKQINVHNNVVRVSQILCTHALARTPE
jgi:hypothetical protein